MEDPHPLMNCDNNFEYSLSEFLKNMPNNLSGTPPSSPGHLWVFWMEDNQDSQSFQILKTAESLAIKLKIIYAFHQLAFLVNQIALLQFWAPKIINGQIFLTTSDQPFALTKLHRGLCSYRKQCLNYKVSMSKSEQLFPVGRAFQNRLLESTPDVQYYLAEHFPLRDHALLCDVGEYLAIPVFESPGLHCVGILELIFTSKGFFTLYEINKIQTAFQAFDLKCLNCQSFVQISTYQPQAIDEIEEMLKVVVQKHQLRFAQIWIPCKHFDPILNTDLNSHSNSKNGWKEHIMLKTTHTRYPFEEFDHDVASFRRACELSHIKIGNGVVGRAFSSYGACFCIDITNFNCMEYPLVHYARKYGLTASFAICLRSSDDIYILEFFLPSSPIKKREPQGLLESLVSTIMQNLTNFKIASEREFEEKLFVEVIDFYGPNLYEIWSTVIHPTRLGAIQSGGKMEYFDGSDSKCLMGTNATNDEVVGFSSVFVLPENRSTGKALVSSPEKTKEESDAMKIGSDFVNDEEKVIVVTSTEKESLKYTSGAGKEHGIDRNVLEQHFGMKQEDVAKKFGISKSTLKRICRKNNILRWPPYKRNEDCRSLTPLEPILNAETQSTEHDRMMYTAFNEQPEIAAHFLLDNVTMQMQNSSMTIKATYGGDIIKFQLALSSSLLDLEEEIAKRLKLEVGSFNIKYLDEDDEWILLCCNTDLKNCISTSTSLGLKTIKMLIQLVNS